MNSQNHSHLRNRVLAASAMAVLAVGGPALAQPQPFQGFDYAVQPGGPMTNAWAANAAWVSSLGSLSHSITCETFSEYGNVTFAPGSSSSFGTALLAFPFSVGFNPVAPTTGGVILNGATDSIVNGWDTDTTAWYDAQQRLSLVVGNQVSSVDYVYDINFSVPIQAFGMFVTGNGNAVPGGAMYLTFSDASGTYTVPMTNAMGGLFVGFSDLGQQVYKVSLVMTPDVTGQYVHPHISLDDICIVLSTDGGGYCPSDFDHSGFVDIDDFTSFVGAFEAGTDDADFDHSAFVDLDDFVGFVHAFEEGC